MSQPPNKKTLKTTLDNFVKALNYKFACWQGHCPTAEEIRNSEIKILANRMKGHSREETLTNILDWQERNLEFWTERHPLRSMLLAFISGSTVIGSFAFFALIIFAALVFHFFSFLSLVTWYSAIWLTITLTGAILILMIMVQVIHSNRKIPRYEGLKNALVNSIPIKALLENRLGVCRDYAKLTACLLLNIYPDAEIYFAYAPSHVATGIMIENKLYMLDQRLPILTLDKWNKYRHLKGKLDKLGKNILESVNTKPFLSQTSNESLDTQQLTQTVTKLLNIKELIDDKELLSLKIIWKNGAIKYQNEELVNYSLRRLLETRISNELVQVNQITKLELTRNKNDLIFNFWFRKD